jgi:hypothetical protein
LKHKHEIFALDLIYETMAKPDGSMDQSKAKNYLRAIEDIDARLTPGIQAALLADQGWEALKTFIKASKHDQYKGTPLDPEIFTPLCKEHQVHPTAYAYLSFCTGAIGYFVDGTLGKIRENAISKWPASRQGGIKQDQGSRLLIEGNNMIKSCGPDYRETSITFQRSIPKSHRWHMTTIDVYSDDWIKPHRNRITQTLSRAWVKDETQMKLSSQNEKIIKGAGMAMWSDPFENEAIMSRPENTGFGLGQYVEIDLGPGNPSINGIIQEYKSKATGKKNGTWREKSHITQMTITTRTKESEWLNEQVQTGQTWKVNGISKANTILQAGNWASTLQANDIDHLGAQGALPNLLHE